MNAPLGRFSLKDESTEEAIGNVYFRILDDTLFSSLSPVTIELPEEIRSVTELALLGYFLNVLGIPYDFNESCTFVTIDNHDLPVEVYYAIFDFCFGNQNYCGPFCSCDAEED
jgi:hypothetical protein